MPDKAPITAQTGFSSLKWNDPSVRSAFFQFIAVVLLFWLFWQIFNNTLTNMEKRGISTGFAFLNREAGFGILMSLIDYDETYSYGRTFFVGLINTLLVSSVSIVFATIIGFVIGIARLSNNWLVSRMAAVYIETIRNLPLLLQIIFWAIILRSLPGPSHSLKMGESFFLNNRGLFAPRPIYEDGFGFVLIALLVAFGIVAYLRRWAKKRHDQTGQRFPIFWLSIGLLVLLPSLLFIAMGGPISWEVTELARFGMRGGLNIIPEFIALGWALATYTGAFIAEIVRSGIQAVNKGQTEAAHALGLRNGPTLRLVIVPQAMRVIIPPLTSQYLNLTKNSSLATAIGYPDLVAVFAGTTLNQTGQALEIIGITMATYLTISLVISAFMNWYNHKMALVER